MIVADDGAFARLRQRGGERFDLFRFLALVAGDGTRERIEQDDFRVIAHPLRDALVIERRGELRERFGGIRHGVSSGGVAPRFVKRPKFSGLAQPSPESSAQLM